MDLPQIPYGDWIAAVVTIFYMQLLASGKRLGWVIGMSAQIMWIYMSVSKQLYGMTFLASVLTIQFLYGWRNSGKGDDG